MSNFSQPKDIEMNKPVTQEGKREVVREMFIVAADEVFRQTGLRVVTYFADEFEKGFAPIEPADDNYTDLYGLGGEVQVRNSATGIRKFAIGDTVVLNSGGSAMNVSDVNIKYAVVRCIWTDTDGQFYEAVIPESCLRIYLEGSN